MEKQNDTFTIKHEYTEEKQRQCLCLEKHHFFIFALALAFVLQWSFNPCTAQGSLQFNQVILDSVYAKVPAGKTWKVISIIGTRTIASGGVANFNPGGSLTNPSVSLPAAHSIKINGHQADVAVSVAVGTGAGAGGTADESYYSYMGAASDYTYLGVDYCVSLPIWLPEGTSLVPSTNVALISVIEFNIIP